MRVDHKRCWKHGPHMGPACLDCSKDRADEARAKISEHPPTPVWSGTGRFSFGPSRHFGPLDFKDAHVEGKWKIGEVAADGEGGFVNAGTREIKPGEMVALKTPLVVTVTSEDIESGKYDDGSRHVTWAPDLRVTAKAHANEPLDSPVYLTCTGHMLDHWAALCDLTRDAGETDESLRGRVIAELRKVNGT